MSRNGSGVYSLPAGNPVVTGTTISSSWANTTLSDIATALTGSVAADGQTAMTGNLQMGNNKITGLAVATASGDALSYGQAATISALTVSGLTSGRVTYATTSGLLTDSANLTFNGTTLTANALTVTGATALNGGATLGDASGDALTINSSAVSIPNGLNFDSNTFVIDSTNNYVGIGNSSPFEKLTVTGNIVTNSTQNYIYNNGGSGTSVNSGLFLDGSGNNLRCLTNNTERMRIDSAGNVGIGTSSPDQKVHAYNASSNTWFRAQSGGDNSNGLYMTNNQRSWLWGLAGGTSGSIYLYDLTASAERMRIDSSGNLLVGQTTDTLGSSNSLQVTSTLEVCGLNRNNATDGAILRFKKQGSTVGYISTNTYSLPSDERVKSNIENIGYGLEFVNSLRPVQYNTTFQDQEKLSKKNFGLIAQEVEATLEQLGKSVNDVTFLEKFEPESETESRYGLGYQNLVPVLIKAIQEQQAIITDLKARIETLESK